MTPEPAGHAPTNDPAPLGVEVARDLLYLAFQARFLQASVRDLVRSEGLQPGLAGFRMDPRSTVIARAMRCATDGKGDLCHPGPLAPGPALAFGATPLEFLRHLAAKGTSPASAREGGLSWTDLRRGMIGWGGPRGGTATQVLAGAALAFRQRGEDRAALVFEGHSALQSGGWHEGMNLAGAVRAPLIVVIAAPKTADRAGHSDIEAAAESYGVAFARVGTEPPGHLFQTVAAARRRAVRGEGPTLIELLHLGDEDRWAAHDAFAARAMAAEGLSKHDLDAIRRAARAGVAHAVARLEKEPGPTARDALAPVCTDGPPPPPWTRRDPPAPDTPVPVDPREQPHAR